MNVADAATGFAEGARADNTRRAYAADWACFSSWCLDAGKESLPAEPQTVAEYLTAKAGELGVSTLARRLAAIRAKHRDTDLAVPEGAYLRKVWAGIKRELGRAPKKKKALVLQDLQRVVDALPDTAAGVRDRALFLLWFASACRRSEIAPLELDGPGAGELVLQFVEQGVRIQLGRSKGDRESKGVAIGVAYGKGPYCPVAALEAWLKRGRIRSGPVFRGIDRWGRIGPAAMSPKAASDAVKRSCSRVGLNPRVFAGHSLRRGAITTGHLAKIPLVDLQRIARHKNPVTTAGYIEEAEIFDAGLGPKLGL
jgi:integrase